MLNKILKFSQKYGLPTYKKSLRHFQFANEAFRSLVCVTFQIEVPTGIEPIHVEFDIVIADIPLLLGLDVVDREGLTPDIAYSVLAERTRMERNGNGPHLYVDEWGIPMRNSRSRHSYVQTDYSIATQFTRTQQNNLHKQFFQMSADKLYNLLTTLRPEGAVVLGEGLLLFSKKVPSPCLEWNSKIECMTKSPRR